MNTLRLLVANKHTSLAAVIYVCAKFGSELGAVWLPAHAAQFKSTANIVEAAAVAYGLFAAGDASQTQPPPAPPAPKP